MAVINRNVTPTDASVVAYSLPALFVFVVVGCACCLKRKTTENPTENMKLIAERDNLLEENNRLKTRLQETQDGNFSIKENSRQQMKNLASVTEEKNRLSSENQKLTKKLEILEDEKKATQDENFSLKENLRQISNNLATETEKRNHLSSENQKLTEKLKILKQFEDETNRLKTFLQATQDENFSLKENLRQKSSNLASLTEERNHLSAENQKLTQKLEMLEHERDSLKKEKATLQSEFYQKLTSLQTSHNKLQKENTNLTDELNSALNENKKLSEEVKILNAKLVEASQKYQETKNILEKVQKKAESTEMEMTEKSTKLIKVETAFQQIVKVRLCVMCINNDKLVSVWNALINMKLSQQISPDVHMIQKKLTGILSISKDDFCEANMVVLVGIAEPRNMLISDKEPSQLGVVYREALKLNKHIFMIYVDDKYSDSLKDSQPYHPSLKTMLENQKPIGELAEYNRFISIKIKDKTSSHKFNGAQSMQISKWISTASAS